MMASALSGAMARVPCHPIDTIKARLQTQTWIKGSGTVYRNFVHGLGEIWRAEGLRGLYRGFGPTVLGSIPASCVYFTAYELTKSELGKHFSGDSPFFVHLAGGMIAETVSCVLWVPIDVVKERMQIQSLPKGSSAAELKLAQGHGFYSGGADAMRSIWRTEGLAGFYRGYGATVLSFGPFSALYFTFYEQLKRKIERSYFDRAQETYVSQMPTSVFLFCGAVAGAGASFFTNPLDLVKLRMQVQRQSGREVPSAERYLHTGDGLVKLARSEGMPGMLRGVGARMAFHAPATAIGMALFEKLKTVTYAIV